MGNSSLFILILVFQIYSATGLRRSLHEPLFPNSPTSAPSPAPSPDLQSEPPPRVISNEPFFPLSPPAVPASYTPPAPPANSIAANVTTTPKSNSNSSHKKLVAAFAVCGSLIVVFCLILFCLGRYRKRAEDEHWGWAATKLSADTTPLGSSTPGAHNNGSNPRVLSPAKVVALNGGSDALYLGTFANRTVTESQSEETALKQPSDLDSQHRDFSPLRNATKPADRYGRGSPEIHPLPPLEKKPPRPLHSPDSSDDESFYSPKGQSTPSRHGSPMIPPPRRSLFSASFDRKTPKSRSSLSSSASSPKRKVQTRLSFSSSGSSSSSAQTSPSLDSPTAPITPTVTTPPIRAHSNSPPRHYSLNDYAKSHQQHLSFTSKPQPSRPPGATVVASNTEPKRAPPPPPPLPPPFKPSFPPSNSNFQNPKGKNGHLNSLPLQPDLPPLPVRPAPRFLSSSRSGKLAQSIPASSRNPPPPPPSGLYCSRTGQPLQALQTPETPPERSDSVGSDQTPKTKLKPLHWDKVRASPRKPMVWDQLKSGSFQLDEEMIESLFVYSTPAPVKPDAAKQSASAANQNRLLDPKKSQNIAILLRALNVTREEVCEALLDGTYDSVGTELLETLSKMAPSRDEEIKLKEFRGDVSKIGTSERFLKALLEIPFAFKRIDAMLYKANFEEEIVTIKKSFKILEAACQELTSSRLFLKLLEAVLKTGNRMNIGTARGDAQAFKLDTLLKLVDVKGTDGKTTLLHFVVLEIIKAEGSRVANDQSPSGSAHGGGFLGSGDPMKEAESKSPKVKDEEYKKLGLEVVAGLSTELSNVKSAAGMDSEGLTHSVTNLARGLDKLKEILQMMQGRESNEAEAQGNFLKTMSSFLERAEQDIDRIQEEEKSAFSHVRETTEYFHGDAIKEEARPLRFFMVVRDFLGVLDQVCREIGRTHIKVNKNHNLARHTVVAHPISMPVFARAYERRYESSDDDSSSSS